MNINSIERTSLPYCVEILPDDHILILNRNYMPLNLIGRFIEFSREEHKRKTLPISPTTLRNISINPVATGDTKFWLYNDSKGVMTDKTEYKKRLIALNEILVDPIL